MTTIPHDEAEKHVLGSILLSRAAIEEVAATVEPTDFHAPRHETIYTAALTLHARGDGVDPITVAAELQRTGELTKIGGAPYLHDLTAAVPTAANAGYYARIVRDQAVRRRGWTACTRGVQLFSSGEGDVDELVEAVRGEIDDISKATADTRWLATTIDGTLEQLEQPTPTVPTPWDALNHLIGGWAPGRLYVIGARPAVGKSLVAINAATHLARTHPVALSTLEMSEQEVHHRVIAYLASVNLKHLIEHRVEDHEWDRIARAQVALRALRLSIDDRAAATVTDVASHARTATRQTDGRLGAVIVDYLQLMSTPQARRNENREQQVAAMSRRLKILARELDTPVIALSQLNRTSEQRADKRPTMADLRESGAIEQDSDVVILLHVEENDPGTLHVAVAKNRHGPTGSFTLTRAGHYARITDNTWTPAHHAYPEN